MPDHFLCLYMRHLNNALLELDLGNLNKLLHRLNFNAWHFPGDLLYVWDHDMLLNLTYLNVWHLHDSFLNLWNYDMLLNLTYLNLRHLNHSFLNLNLWFL